MMTSFMQDVLVQWIKTLWRGDSEMTYSDLADGIFLCDAFRDIDPKSNINGVISSVEDVKDRLQNWDILWKSINDYYSDVLQELIVMSPPNLIAISREPDSVKSQEEVRKALMLLLGAAVQCEKKEDFIDAIRIHLDDAQQGNIMDCIQTVHPGHGSRLVIHKHTAKSLQVRDADSWPHRYDNLMSFLANVVHQRDHYVEDVKDVLQQVDILNNQLETLRAQMQQQSCAMDRSANPTGNEKHHLGVELAEAKAKMRKMRTELEEKAEQVSEYREELEDQKKSMMKLQETNRQLTMEARTARTYRDEVDVLREKAARVDRLEAEVGRCKGLLNELDFNRALVQELREDKQLLEQNMVVLEDQLQAAQKRVERACDLEGDVQRYKEKLDNMCQERDDMYHRIDSLVDENNRLLHEHRSTLHESASLEEELARTRAQGVGTTGRALSDQLNESANSKLRRLELDNNRLQHELTELRQNSQLENSSRILELEKENHRLSKKVEKLQLSSSSEVQTSVQLQEEMRQVNREKKELLSTMETVKENCDRQIQELEKENETLSETLQVLRQRCEKTSDSRVNELERDNSRLQQTLNDVSSRLSRQEFELKQQKKVNDRQQEMVNRLRDFENENERLARESSDYQRELHVLKATVERTEELERQLSDLEVENAKLVKTLENYKKSLQNKDRVEQENISMQTENAKLSRMIDAMKKTSTRVADLENERDELKKQLSRAKKAVESGGSERQRLEQLEMRQLELESQNSKLRRQLESTNERTKALEEELNSTDSENEKLQKNLESLKITMKQYEEMEKENARLERENLSVSREKASLDKENKRLKQAIEVKEKSVDTMSRRVSDLEQNTRHLKKTSEAAKDADERVKEVEREKFELVQQMAVDKKTLSALREDLMNEKIRGQKLSNELDQVNHELEKIGLNRQQLQQAQQSIDVETKFKALEAMMEETARRTLEIKEQKIFTLETRLEESKSRNVMMQAELQRCRSELEALKQRYDEEFAVLNGSRRGSTASNTDSLTRGSAKKLLELQDHLVQLERRNATMEAENSNLQVQNAALQERVQKSEAKNSGLHEEIVNSQKQTSDLLAANAKLQVENTTLQSQSASMMAQNAQLQLTLNEMENETNQVSNQLEELQQTHQSLVRDHEQLQKLHEQLTSEYENLLNELSQIKGNQKTLRSELREKENLVNELLKEKDSVKHLKEALEKEKNDMRDHTSRNHVSLRAEVSRLTDERDRLSKNNDKIEFERRNLQRDYRSVRQENSELQNKCADQLSSLEEYRGQLNSLDVELAKMVDKYEILNQQNAKLEDEKKALMLQLQSVMSQNQNLLTQTLENSEHHFEEEISLRDQLANLKRQKEKLEEKIMDQYKRYPSPKKHRTLGEKIVRRAKDMLAKRKSATEIKGRIGDMDGNDDKYVQLRKRSQSMYNVTDSMDSTDLSPSNRFAIYEDVLDADDGILSFAKNCFPGAVSFMKQDDIEEETTSKSSQSSLSPTTSINRDGAKSTDDITKINGQENQDYHHFGDWIDFPSSVADDVTELDCSGPVPQLRFSQTPPPRKLVPGSMSIYDRSPDHSPRDNMMNLREFLNDLDKKAGGRKIPPSNSKQAPSKSLRGNRRNSVGNLKEHEDDDDAGFGRDWGTTRAATPTSRRQLPATPPVSAERPRTSLASRCRSVPVDRQLRAVSPPPTPPSRNTSLPVTERSEKQLSSSTASPAPSGSSGGAAKPSPPSSSTTKVILSRMVAQVNAPRPGTSMGLPSRPFTPQDPRLPSRSYTPHETGRSRTPGPERGLRTIGQFAQLSETLSKDRDNYYTAPRSTAMSRQTGHRSPTPPQPPARQESSGAGRRSSAPTVNRNPPPPRRDASLFSDEGPPPPPPPRAESSAGTGTKPQLQWYSIF